MIIREATAAALRKSGIGFTRTCLLETFRRTRVKPPAFRLRRLSEALLAAFLMLDGERTRAATCSVSVTSTDQLASELGLAQSGSYCVEVDPFWEGKQLSLNSNFSDTTGRGYTLYFGTQGASGLFSVLSGGSSTLNLPSSHLYLGSDPYSGGTVPVTVTFENGSLKLLGTIGELDVLPYVTFQTAGTLDPTTLRGLGLLNGANNLNKPTLQFTSSTTFAVPIYVQGAGAINLGGGTVTQTSAIQDSGGAGSLLLSNGTMVMADSFTGFSMSGTLTIDSNAHLSMSNDKLIGPSQVIVNGTLQLPTGSGLSIKSLGGNGTVNLGSQYLSLQAASNTFSGSIQGSAGLNVTGAEGLSGTNTYT
ncbi:MAG: hypothetical protein KGS28_11250, partial [Betaproteobacteria bacterium]|nr:hypothetical protein [Betaproteobacteria bacterium]